MFIRAKVVLEVCNEYEELKVTKRMHQITGGMYQSSASTTVLKDSSR